MFRPTTALYRYTFWLPAFTTVLLTPNVRAQAESSPIVFYKSLGAAINNASGTVLLDLTGGYWQGTTAGRVIRWANDDPTVARFSFDYKGTVLQSAKLEFSPAVHLWVRVPNGPDLALGVRSVTYNQFGDQLDWDVFYDRSPAPGNPNALSPLRRALAISRDPKDLLAGKLFVGLTSPRRCSSQYTECMAGRPLVSRVRFVRLDEASPALSIDLKPQSTIYFSRAKPGTHLLDNFVVVRTGGLLLDDVEYDVDAGHIHGAIDRFALVVERGQLLSRDVELRFGGGSKIQFDRLGFRRERNGETIVDAEFGTLALSVRQGSRLGLSTGVLNSSFLVFDDGTDLALQGFALIVDDRRAITVRIGGGSTVAANIRDGRLGFGSNGWLALKAGSVRATLSGTWDSGARPDATLGFTSLDVTLAGGEVDLNSTTHVGVTSGLLKSSQLAFQGLHFAGLTGTVSDLQLTLADKSTVGIPNGVVITTDVAATIAADPARPLELKPGLAYPLGGIKVDLPFRRFANASAATFALANGRFAANIQTKENWEITGSDGVLTGTMSLESPVGTVDVIVDADGGSFRRSPTGNFELEIGLRGELRPGLSLNVETPFIKGYTDEDGEHKDARFFPLRLQGTLPTPTRFAQRKLRFHNGVVDLPEQTVAVPWTLTIPGGLGEHQIRDDPNSADGTHGPNEVKHWQEAFFDDHLPCDFHLYLAPAQYGAASQLRFSIVNNDVALSMTQIRLDRQAEFKTDGCDPSSLLVVVSSFAGFLIAGPVGAGAGAAAGFAAGDKIEAQVNTLIAGLIARKLNEQEKTWRVRIPGA